MNVDDVVAEKIAAARARTEAAKRRRSALAAARQRGLAHRHAQKLRNLSRGDIATTTDLRVHDGRAGVGQASTTVGQTPTVATVSSTDADDIVIEMTEAEFAAAARAALARLGLTYAELEDQARRRDFTSAQAHSLWVSVGDTVRPELLNNTIEEN